MRLFFFSAALFVLCTACGSRDVDVIYDTPKPIEAYTFEELKAKCTKCHPGNGVSIPLEEALFRGSAKVRSEIEGGDMPPNPEGFDKSRALAFFK